MEIDLVSLPANPPESEPIDPLFCEFAELMRQDDIAYYGNEDLTLAAEQYYMHSFDLPYWNSRYWLAFPVGERGAGRAVAAAQMQLSQAENAHIANVSVVVRPSLRGQGIGSAVAAAMADEVKKTGRTIVHVYSTHHPYEGSDGVVPKTGLGALPPQDAAPNWLPRLGFELEEVDSKSIFRIPAANSEEWRRRRGLHRRFRRDTNWCGGAARRRRNCAATWRACWCG